MGIYTCTQSFFSEERKDRRGIYKCSQSFSLRKERTVGVYIHAHNHFL